jgi:hypothetical protein
VFFCFFVFVQYHPPKRAAKLLPDCRPSPGGEDPGVGPEPFLVFFCFLPMLKIARACEPCLVGRRGGIFAVKFGLTKLLNPLHRSLIAMLQVRLPTNYSTASSAKGSSSSGEFRKTLVAANSQVFIFRRH